MGAQGELTEFGHAMKKHFLFDAKWTNLNHGSFGTYPASVRDALRQYQDLTDAAPDRFMFYEYIEPLDKAREAVASLLQAPVEECVFMLNASTGVNTVLRNLTYNPKDTIIYFDTVYSAVEKSLLALKETYPQIHLARVENSAHLEYRLPATHADILNAFSQTISRLLYEGYTPKVAIFDTIVSLPGVRFPFERLVKICKEYGIFSLIDGAHGIGQIPLNLSTLDPDFFVSNCHKWMYTPRGTAVFFVPKRNQHLLRTTIPTSHGYIPPPGYQVRRVMPPSDKSDFVNLFQYVGTADNSPHYCAPVALEFRRQACGGEEAIYTYIRDLAQRGADLLAGILGTEVMDDLDVEERAAARKTAAPWSGGLRDCAMANVLIPLRIVDGETNGVINGSASAANGTNSNFVTVKRDHVQAHVDWMHRVMTYELNTRVLIYEYKGQVWTRVSGQIYLELKDFEWLGHVLKGLCERVRRGESLDTQQKSSAAGAGENLDVEAVGGGVEAIEL